MSDDVPVYHIQTGFSVNSGETVFCSIEKGSLGWTATCTAGNEALTQFSSFSLSSLGVQANAEVHDMIIDMGPFHFSNVKIKTASGWINNTVAPTAANPYYCYGSPFDFIVFGPNSTIP